MELTSIGIWVAVAALILMRRSVSAMLSLLMVCTLFGGAAALNLPMLGDTSVPPASFALCFLLLRLTIASFQGPLGVVWAAERNVFLGLFVLYGVVGGYVFPRMFEGQIELAPMRVAYYLGQLQGEPLRPTPQNTTQSVYLVGTLLAAICATISVRKDQKLDLAVKTVFWLGWAHCGFGVLDVGLYSAGLDHLLDPLRNGAYEMTAAEIGSFKRISGVFPEASTYATYGFALFAVTSELWVRDIRPKLAGPTTLALMLMVLGSTSSTGIVAILAYGPILAVRILMVRPAGLAMRKATTFGAVSLFGLFGGLLVILLRPDLANDIGGIFQGLVFGKAQTESGIQRAYWAKQGLDAFLFTGGLGVGPGSFRSSSLLTAVLGSVGAVGTICLGLHLWRLWSPIGARRREVEGGQAAAISRAFGWGAAAGLLAPVISASGPDPGLLFAAFSGISIGAAVRWTSSAVQREAREVPAFPAAPRRAPKLGFRAPKPLAEAAPAPAGRLPEPSAPTRRSAPPRRRPRRREP